MEVGKDGLAIQLSNWIKDFTHREGRKPSKVDMPPDVAEDFRRWQQGIKGRESLRVTPAPAAGNRFIRQSVKKSATCKENKEAPTQRVRLGHAVCDRKTREEESGSAVRAVLSPTQFRRGGRIAQEEPLAFQHVALLTQCTPTSSAEPDQPSATRIKPVLELPPCPDAALLGATPAPLSAPNSLGGNVDIQDSLPETNTAPLGATLAKEADCIPWREIDPASSRHRQSRATSACPPEPDLHTGLCKDDSSHWKIAPQHGHCMRSDGDPRPISGGDTADCEPAETDSLPDAQPIDQGLGDAWEFEVSEDEAAAASPLRGCHRKSRACAPARIRLSVAARAACPTRPEKKTDCDLEEARISVQGQACKAGVDAEPSNPKEFASGLKRTRRPPAKGTKLAAGAKRPHKRRKRLEDDSACTSSSSESNASDTSEEDAERAYAGPASRRRRGAAAGGSGRQRPRKGAAQRDGTGNGEGEQEGDCNGGKKQPAAAAKRRQNFVRINFKGGAGKFGFKSKSGMRNQRGRGGRSGGRFGRKFATKWLPQAGDGADYVDGWEPRAGNVCFKCGRSGHWASACPGPVATRDQGDAEDSGLEQVAEQAEPVRPRNALPQDVPAAAMASTSEPSPELVQLLERARAEQSEQALLEVLSSVFGHAAFRVPQLAIIQKVLRGTSTLAILPTGAGKSLCYQLPALVQGGTTLVVSPLVALMRDQLSHLPAALPAAMLWRGQSKQEALQTLSDLKEGKLRVLYVAPERLHNVMLLQALAPLLPLPLVVVDEAHCMAEWGHNFRSAYFRLGHMLRQKLPCRAVLALTATATHATQESVMRVLDIPPAHLVRQAVMPPNLRLCVLHIREGLGSIKLALLRLVKGGLPVQDATVIVYTTFQSQADEIAGYLYNNEIAAASYHAGKSDMERTRIQEDFCKRKLRVVVATLAFGMGLDAAHVRGVVHLNLPRSLEEYVQQVGRAGRDGAEGHCHLFLSDSDFQRLRSLGHADEVGRENVAAFLQEVFDDSGDGEGMVRYGMLGIAKLSQQLDAKEEVLETLLSYLEAAEEQYVHVLPPTSLSVKVSFYDSEPGQLAELFPVVQAILQTCPKPRRGIYDVPMAGLCNALCGPPSQVLKELKDLAAKDQVRFELSKLNALAFEVRERPLDVHSLAAELCRRHTRACRQQVHRLDTAYRTFAEVGAVAEPAAQEVLLRERINAYFEREADAPGIVGLEGLPLQPVTGLLRADLRALQLQTQRNAGPKELPFSGRAAARILHGISSPAFPAKEWAKCGFWGRYTATDFGAVLRAAIESC